MAKTKQEPLIVVLMRRGGLKKAQKVGTFLMCYWTARSDLQERGEWPESLTLTKRIEEGARWWREGHRKWWSDLAVYRELVPEYPDPEDLIVALEELQAEKGRTMEVDVAGVLA